MDACGEQIRPFFGPVRANAGICNNTMPRHDWINTNVRTFKVDGRIKGSVVTGRRNADVRYGAKRCKRGAHEMQIT